MLLLSVMMRNNCRHPFMLPIYTMARIASQEHILERNQDKTNKVQTELENKQLKIVTSSSHMLRVNYLHYSNYLTPEAESITNLRKCGKKPMVSSDYVDCIAHSSVYWTLLFSLQSLRICKDIS